MLSALWWFVAPVSFHRRFCPQRSTHSLTLTDPTYPVNDDDTLFVLRVVTVPLIVVVDDGVACFAVVLLRVRGFDEGGGADDLCYG